MLKLKVDVVIPMPIIITKLYFFYILRRNVFKYNQYIHLDAITK